jgi:putative transposase
MPWKQDDIVELRKQFIDEYLGRNYPDFSHLCHRYGISRPTGYKWIERFMKGGIDNLVNRPCAPKTHRTKLQMRYASSSSTRS